MKKNADRRWMRCLVRWLPAGLVVWVFWPCFVGGDWGLLVALLFTYLVAPIQHPADYNSYRQWWDDRRNWFSANGPVELPPNGGSEPKNGVVGG